MSDHSTFVVSLALLLSAVPAARANTIVSVSGTATSAYTIGLPGTDQILETSWTSATAYSNVSVSAEITGDGSLTVISAFLTNAIGPAENSANVIASKTLTPIHNFYGPGMETLFSGLTLAPGTYYLVLGGGLQEEGEWWGTASTPATIQTDVGVSYGGDETTDINPPFYYGFPDENNPPDSTFMPTDPMYPTNFIFSVTGTPLNAVPEPAYLWLMMISLCSLCCVVIKVRIVSEPKCPVDS